MEGRTYVSAHGGWADTQVGPRTSPVPGSAALRPRARALALEISRCQIEVPQLDSLEAAKADAAQLRFERRRVAHEHDRQAIGLQIRARDPLDVVHRHRV